LDIDSSPSGARVTLDGKNRGTTPTVIPDLRATQQYQLVLKHRRHPAWRGTIFYDGKPVKEVRARLEQKPKKPSTPRKTEKQSQPKPGPAPVAPAVKRPEPTPPEPVEQPEPKKQPEAAKSTPPSTGQFGTLRLNSKPWGKVWIDGRDINRNTPLLDYRIEAGEHTIKIEFSTGENKTEKITIRPGETTTKLITGTL